MLSTVEVRWFLRGSIPPVFLRWFDAQGNELDEQLPRVDYYLRIADSDSPGIKLREGRIEVKQRVGQPDVARFGEHAVGRVERWRKWSFALNEPAGLEAEFKRFASPWIAIRKERQVRTYQVTADERVRQVTNSHLVSQGCSWEVAKVRLVKAEDEWWSLGFEAFGQESVLKDMMLLVAQTILSLAGAPALQLEDSYGYPMWLQHVGKLHI